CRPAAEAAEEGDRQGQNSGHRRVAEPGIDERIHNRLPSNEAGTCAWKAGPFRLRGTAIPAVPWPSAAGSVASASKWESKNRHTVFRPWPGGDGRSVLH